MVREVLPTPSVHPSAGNYSHAVRVGGLTFVSGQVPLAKDGSLVGPDDIAAQCRQVFANLRDVLGDIGAGFDDVAKLTTYLTRPADLDAYRAARDEMLTPPFPASALVIVKALANPAWLVEVEAIVATPG